MPLAKRLLIGLGPMALTIVVAVCWVVASVNGYMIASGGSLALVNLLVIAASLWAVYFLRKTWPRA